MSGFLGMSDEDFLKAPVPDEAVATAEVETAVAAEPAVAEPESAPAAEAPVEEKSKEDAPQEPATEPVVVPGSDVEQPVEERTTNVSTEPAAREPAKDSAPEAIEATQPEPSPDATPNYEAFYQQIMKPFKANGKTIELRSPEEAIQLMQMGANYTRKMQDLVPHRKVLLMLENNGLLDEGKLSYLIDLEKKNPDAIRKLVKDAGIDPLEIDTAAEPAYREGNHRVSDEEASFRTALDDLQSNPTGQETLKLIHTGWDQASKEVLWKSPEVLQIIHQQRENGIYDRIASEIDRRKTLGAIGPEVPFLHAYKAVGDDLVKANAFADLGNTPAASAPAPASVTQPVVVATRVAAPKPVVSNNERVNAASPTRTTASKAKEFINPLAMSDDEFLKQMSNRV